MANFPLLLLEILWEDGGGGGRGYRFGGKLWGFVVVCFCFGYFCFVCVLLFVFVVVFCFLMSVCCCCCGGSGLCLFVCLFVVNVSFVSVVCFVLFFVGWFLFFSRRTETVHDQ